MDDIENDLESQLLALGAIERRSLNHLDELKVQMRAAYDSGNHDLGEKLEQMAIEIRQALKVIQPRIDLVEQKLYRLRRTKWRDRK